MKSLEEEINMDKPKSEFERATELMAEKEMYKKAYHILMEYWDSLPDGEKPDIDKRLKECGL
jgi:hypothetical protein